MIEKESGETIGIVEDWKIGMMELRAKNFLIIIGSVALHSILMVLSPFFQYSNIPKRKAVPLFFMLEMTILPTTPGHLIMGLRT